MFFWSKVTACCLAYSPPPLKHGSLQLLQDFCALHRPSPLWVRRAPHPSPQALPPSVALLTQ